MVAGTNFYAALDSNPAMAGDSYGLLVCMDSISCYAIVNPIGFLTLMADLAIISPLVVAPLYALIDVPVDNTSECDKEKKKEKPQQHYFRGLTQDDLNDLVVYGFIRSNLARKGFGMDEAVRLAANQDTRRDHLLSYTERSPFVSVSRRESTARGYSADEHERRNRWQCGQAC